MYHKHVTKYNSFNVVQIIQQSTNHSIALYKSFNIMEIFQWNMLKCAAKANESRSHNMLLYKCNDRIIYYTTEHARVV